MKINSKIFLFLIALMLTIGINAQSVPKRKLTGDIRFGFNYIQTDISPSSNFDKVRLGAIISALANYRLPGNLRIQSGLNITKKGMVNHEVKGRHTNQDFQDIAIDRKEIIDVNYFLVPLYLGYEKQVGKELSFNINAGAYAAYSFKGYRSVEGFQMNYVGTATDRIDLKEGDKETFPSEYVKRFDYGVGASIGLVYDVYGITLGYEHGLNNISAKSDKTIKNKDFYLGVGFRF